MFASQPVGLAQLIAELPFGYLAVFQPSRNGRTVVALGYKSKYGKNIFKTREIDISVTSSPKADESMVLVFREAFNELRNEINQLSLRFENPS